MLLVGLSFLFAAPCCLWSAPDADALITNELDRLDTLIKATQKSLDDQQTLRRYILEYKRLQELFVLNPDDNELLVKMVRSARKTLDEIYSTHLTQTFDPDFINELTFLSKVAEKRGIPKP
jgi:predicted patatin/cPLA2 family phospholipase